MLFEYVRFCGERAGKLQMVVDEQRKIPLSANIKIGSPLFGGIMTVLCQTGRKYEQNCEKREIESREESEIIAFFRGIVADIFPKRDETCQCRRQGAESRILI